MSFLEHLEELRGALIHSVLFIVVAGIISWPLSGWLQEFVIQHVRSGGSNITFMAGKPLGPLGARLKVTLAMACLLSAPAVFYRLWLFVAPGLLKKERKLILPIVAVSLILFYSGFLASFLFMGPQIPTILLQFSTPSVQNVLAIDDVMSLVLSLSLACGLVGEVPLIITFLVWIGVLEAATLVRQWRIAVVVILIVAAVITPGDYGVTMLLIALPIAGLYVASVFVAFLVGRKRRPRRVEQGRGES